MKNGLTIEQDEQLDRIESLANIIKTFSESINQYHAAKCFTDLQEVYINPVKIIIRKMSNELNKLAKLPLTEKKEEW